MMATNFIFGTDISSYAELKALGVTYFNAFGEKEALPILLKNAGVRAIRLRLFVDPYDKDKKPYGGGTNDLISTLALAKELKEYGFDLVLDFHYSDFWADPGKQFLPKAWQHLSYEGLEERIYTYTMDALTAFLDEGITFTHIQIGNEITNGLLWPHGKLFEGEEPVPFGYPKLARLLNAGIRAARHVMPMSKLIMHLDRGGDLTLYETWFKTMVPLLLPFDVIGLSYYPYWHGTLNDLKENVNNIQQNFNHSLMIMETSYAFNAEEGSYPFVVNATKTPPTTYPFSPQGQERFLLDLYALADTLQLEGVFYWEPAWLLNPPLTWATKAGMKYIKEWHKKEGNEWANQALFSFDGKALPGLYAYLNYWGKK